MTGSTAWRKAKEWRHLASHGRRHGAFFQQSLGELESRQGSGTSYEKVKKDIAFKNDPGKQSLHHAKQKQEMGLGDVNVAYNPNYVVSLEVNQQGNVWAEPGVAACPGSTAKSG